MNNFNAGRFEVHVWDGGWPVQCTLRIDGKDAARIAADDLPDLLHVLRRTLAAVEQERGQQPRARSLEDGK